jgi:hypothetical protein
LFSTELQISICSFFFFLKKKKVEEDVVELRLISIYLLIKTSSFYIINTFWISGLGSCFRSLKVEKPVENVFV